MVPSVVVGEYLMGFPSEERPLQLETLSRYFFLPAFDARCAALAAELSDVGRPSPSEPGSRVVFRADIQIVATAIVNTATQIVTSNVQEYRRIAGNRISVIEVPQVWEQGEMALPTE
jgi:predicted nucleic acid-binding protein